MSRSIIAVLLLGLTLTVARAESEDSASPTVGVDEMFTKGVLVVKGEGVAPPDAISKGQKRLMAERAAKVVAQRELLETIGKVRVSGDTTVESGMRVNDRIRSAVEGVLTGARVIQESYNETEEVAVVYLQLKLDGPYGIVSSLLPALAEQHSPEVQPLPAYKPPVAPSPPPEPADGLIIDASDSTFRPALVNRILTAEGSALFEPSKVAPDILAKRGCGEYTNDVGKAKAILAERGAKHPLVVKITTVVRSTDVQVSEADAARIFAANQKSNFLEGAKVVFVL